MVFLCLYHYVCSMNTHKTSLIPFFATLSLAVAFVFFASCGKNCEEGFTGKNCDVERIPTKVTITKIVVNAFAPLDPAQLQWDVGSGADIYPVVTGENTANVVWSAPTYFQDADANTAYTFQPEIILDLIYPEKYYTIMLMDSDGGTIFNQDDTIATAIFLPYSPGQSFPSVIALNSQNMKVDVHVKYTW